MKESAIIDAPAIEEVEKVEEKVVSTIIPLLPFSSENTLDIQSFETNFFKECKTVILFDMATMSDRFSLVSIPPENTFVWGFHSNDSDIPWGNPYFDHLIKNEKLMFTRVTGRKRLLHYAITYYAQLVDVLSPKNASVVIVGDSPRLDDTILFLQTTRPQSYRIGADNSLENINDIVSVIETELNEHLENSDNQDNSSESDNNTTTTHTTRTPQNAGNLNRPLNNNNNNVNSNNNNVTLPQNAHSSSNQFFSMVNFMSDFFNKFKEMSNQAFSNVTTHDAPTPSNPTTYRDGYRVQYPDRHRHDQDHQDSYRSTNPRNTPYSRDLYVPHRTRYSSTAFSQQTRR